MKTEVGFASKFEAAMSLIERVTGIKTIKTVEQYENAKIDYKQLITWENDLDAEYNALPEVVAAKKAQATKKELATKLEAAKKYLKNTPMLAFERAAEEARQAEERRLQKLAEEAAAKEQARLLAEKKKEFDRLEKERKEAEKKGNAEAAERAAAAAAEVKAQAVDMKENPLTAAVVVVEKTAPSVSRRMVQKWRIKLADGKVYSKADFNKTLRVKPADVPGVPSHFFVLDPTAISGVIDSLGKNHNIPGVIWYEEPA